MKEIKVFAPASIANLSCGYDILGVCLDNIGDEIIVLDGSGGEYLCQIIECRKNEVIAKRIKATNFPKETNLSHLIISPIKSQDRIEWLIEKSIEIGVSKISFIKTARTERSKLKMGRINKIAISERSTLF